MVELARKAIKGGVLGGKWGLMVVLTWKVPFLLG